VLLKVTNLTKVFTVGLFKRREIVAVDDVSFDVEPGEFISLVGESGSGKTTTARMILKLLPPTSGEVIFEGRDVFGLKGINESRSYYKSVHSIFQDPYAAYNPLHKIDRVLNQVFKLTGHLGTERDRLVKEALKEVGLRHEDVLGKYPHELSGGQRQRIMVARCYMLRPKLILADEPISMIDASTKASILKLFSKLRDEYKTSVIFITHDLGLAYYVSDEVLIMSEGSIVEKGSPDDIMNRPQHPYTKKLREDIPLFYRKWPGF